MSATPILKKNDKKSKHKRSESEQQSQMVTQSSTFQSASDDARTNRISNSISQSSNMRLADFMPGALVSNIPIVPVVSNVIYQNPFIPQLRSTHEQNILLKLSEIILNIHVRREFVSRERVQSELFNCFGVNSWQALGVRPGTLGPLVNLTDRLKKVTFYMQIFEQVCMLCTLYDLGPILAKFLQVNTYEDAYLGPLVEHPDVKRVFRYEPTQRYQPIPMMTSANVISLFIDFQAKFRRYLQFGEFLDQLVYFYQLRTREELGLYCKSFPFLVQVSNNVHRNSVYHINEMQIKALQELTGTIMERLSELKREVHDEIGLSSYNKKKSPIAVFNHLTSIVERCLPFIVEQPFVYATLIHLRQNELFQWLFNISIYLGTIETPDVFITELQEIFQRQNNYERQNIMMQFYQSLPYDPNISTVDYGRIQSMLQHQQNPVPTVNTSVTNSLQPPTNRSRPKLSVTLKQFCSYLFEKLIHYDKALSIKQFLQIENHLCTKYDVDNFAAFKFDDDDTDDADVNLVSFLDAHQMLIDPNKELSVYGYNVPETDRRELLDFANQLIESNSDKRHVSSQAIQFDIDTKNEDIQISIDNLSILEKAIKQKFGGLLGFRTGTDILRKVKQSHTGNVNSIIHFEESLLDFHYLDRMNKCPPMPIINENQLCEFILQCPIMNNLYTWLQWTHFFEPEYGNLKSFIRKHMDSLQNLLLLETSTDELLLLPTNATIQSFEGELKSFNIRSAVGHLCALITCEYGLITRIPLNVYRTSMHAWFTHLRSLSMIQTNNNQEPIQYVLEFLTYLPILIGQARLIQEIILGPLDDVFWQNGVNVVSVRATIWKLADEKQRNKLEIWGHTLDINEWKNNNKWSGQYNSIENQVSLVETPDNRLVSSETNPVHVPATIPTVPIISSTTCQPNSISIEIKNNNEKESGQTAFEHIESIRRGFGVDGSLDSNSQAIVNNLQGKVERSLQKLSKDLYSDQGHFLLELIQNADDNHYTSDRLPTLRFVVSDQRVLVCNNEIGFQINNVNAICDIGATTKGKHKQGYAGHKGIGFKSVFMISNCPEVHSRDYHFCFDTVEGTQQIGYIRPIWLDKCEEILPNSEEWTTCIRLPIQRGNRLKENFNNIQAKLLLFLNRLRQIEIIDQPTSSPNDDQTRTFTRIDHANGKIIELQEKTINGKIIKNFWLVVKRVIEVPEYIKEKLGEIKCDVHSTTIAIAYPLSGLQKSAQQLPPAQPLFAYLPLRSYGFRFILQADFEIPVTRQEILHDNIWNEWLKSEMVQLLPEAYESFQGLSNLLISSLPQLEISNQLTPIQILIYFLKLIPTRNELDPYFNTFVNNSMKILEGMIRLPVSREDGTGQKQIEWVPISQCVLVKDPFIRTILPQELLLSHFNKYYVPEQLASECNERTLIKLGCAPLQFSSIIRLIKELYKQHELEHSTKTSSIEQIAQWLVCIDYILQQQENDQLHGDHNERNETTTIFELKQLKIIPLSGQSRLVSIDEYNDALILFPLSKTAHYNKPFRIVLDDLPRLDERLLEYIEARFPRRYRSIECLLKKLGMIDKPKIKDIYQLHIRPILLDPSRWSTKSHSVLVAFLLCIYTHFDQFKDELNQLQKHMIIKIDNGEFVRLDNPDVIIHLTSTYGCTRSLESLISSKHKFTFISDDYINNYRTELFSTKDDINKFARFLEQLNIKEFLQVNISDTHFIKVSQLQNTKWAYLIPQLDEMIHQPFIIEDCCCNEFEKLVTPSNNIVTDIELYTKLLIYFDRNYDILSTYYTASIIFLDQIKSEGRRPKTTIPSTFALSMREHAWIPIEGGKLAKSNDVYCLHPKSETLYFHRYVPHLDQTKLALKNKHFILNILGLKEHVLPMTMFELFIQWSCGLDRDTLWTLINETNQLDMVPYCIQSGITLQSCSDTIENIRRVYHFLIDDNETVNLLSRFRDWPLVFVPKNNSEGIFLFAHQVYWHDSTSLLSKLDTNIFNNLEHRVSIQKYYGNDTKLKQFFHEILQVTSEPAIDDYFPLLTQMINVNDIWRLIEVIVRLVFEHDRQIEVKERCLNLPFIPCMGTNNNKVKYADQPFYPHDADIANSLANTLPIIKLPDWILSPELKSNFCSLFDIQSLSDIIQLQVDVDNEQLSIDLFNFYSHSIQLIQSFLLIKSFITEERSKYLTSVFGRMHFVCVDRIQLSYNYQTDTLRKESCDTYVDERAGRFYILKKFENSERHYIDAMAKYLVQDRWILDQLIPFMRDLLRMYQIEGEQSLIKQCDNMPTPEHEYKWIFPNVYFTQPSPLPIEEIALNKEPVYISAEMTQQLINEPVPERKPRSQITVEKDETKNPTCFPAKANTIESAQLPNTKSQSADSANVSSSNHSSPSGSSAQVSRESASNCTTKNNAIVESSHRVRVPSATIDCSNSTSVEVDTFESIRISTLTGSNVYPLPTSSITINPIGNITDDKTGRQGEEIVFRYLQWQNPNKKVEWMNEKQESGLPYDIRIKVKKQTEFVEVKTTRTDDQHTFRISIAEIDWLLKNPMNYHIYRVYYTDNLQTTKISILNQVKHHLEQKQLALCMTIMQRADQDQK